VFAIGCGRQPLAPSSAGSPLPPARLAPADESATIKIVNGWTGAAVQGAEVTAGGNRTLSDDAGSVRLHTTGACLTIHVTAPGFLDRRTCAVSEITLWPIADAFERDATRTMVFLREHLIGSESSAFVTQVTLAPELRASSDIVSTWRSAANDVETLTQGRLSFAFGDYPTEALVIGSGNSLACEFWPSTWPVWPVRISLFCPEAGDDYWIRLRVMSAGLADIRVAERALLWSVGIVPHPLPGLLNIDHPADQLSEFERKTLHMIGLRRTKLAWPDFDVP
jgi:hypothetical protein